MQKPPFSLSCDILHNESAPLGPPCLNDTCPTPMARFLGKCHHTSQRSIIVSLLFTITNLLWQALLRPCNKITHISSEKNKPLYSKTYYVAFVCPMLGFHIPVLYLSNLDGKSWVLHFKAIIREKSGFFVKPLRNLGFFRVLFTNLNLLMRAI